MLTIFLKDIVQKSGACIGDDLSLRAAIEVMSVNQKGLVVVLKADRPVGIITERDIVGLLHEGVDLDQQAYPFAKKSLVTTKGDRTIGYALNLMIENNIRRIIVTGADHDFLGVTTQQDLLRYMEEDFYRSYVKVKHILERQRPLMSAMPEETLQSVVNAMTSGQVSSVPVIRDGKAVGIITEKDILGLALSNTDFSDAVSLHMSSPVIDADIETTLLDIVKTMNNSNIRRIVINQNGTPMGVMTIRDVLRNLEGDYSSFLERTLKNTRQVLNLFPEILLELTDTGDNQFILWANKKALSVFADGLLDRPVTDLVPAERWHDIHTTLLKTGKVEDVMFKNHESIYQFSGFYVTTDSEIEKGRIQLILRNITEEVKLADTDALTNVYNRRFMNDFMIKEIPRSVRKKRHFTIVMADADNFKGVNDTYGHVAGDEVLKYLSRLLTDHLRQSDVVGRYGGEEFLIIMPETTKEEAYNVVERLRARIASERISLPCGEAVTITASFGGSTFPKDGESSEDLLIKADERMYQAKREGKNRVVF